MVRLIDADKMIKRIESWNTSDATDKALYNFTLNRIIEQPTVDAVPVIRCKDCKYNPEKAMSYLDDDLIEGYIHCGHLGDEGFCSLGKRKEE